MIRRYIAWRSRNTRDRGLGKSSRGQTLPDAARACPGLDDPPQLLVGVGRAWPGALAHVAGDALGIVRLAAQQVGDRGLDLLRVGGAVVAQQGGGVGGV